jgi:hypothetical protein
MTRLLTLVALSLAMAFAPAFGEAGAQRIHVTAKIVEQTFTGDLADPQIGDKLITSVELFDERDQNVGTGTGVCTVVSAPPPDIRIQCLSTAVFPNGQIMFGGFAPSLPEVGAAGRFGILGGTDDFRTARGEATIVVITPELQEATFDLE